MGFSMVGDYLSRVAAQLKMQPQAIGSYVCKKAQSALPQGATAVSYAAGVLTISVKNTQAASAIYTTQSMILERIEALGLRYSVTAIKIRVTPLSVEKY